MLYGFYFHRLHGASKGVPGGEYFDTVLEVPIVDVFAATAITGFTVGLLNNVPGGASCYIRGYRAIKDNWMPGDFDLGGDPINNSLYIRSCLSIQFRLAVIQCEAYAQASILVLSEPHTPFGGSSLRVAHDFEIVSPEGQVVRRASFAVLEKDSRIDVQAELVKAVADVAHTTKRAPADYRVRPRESK